ncbi:MAG: ComEC/Rec2 family competence protein [Candidatus Yonathbacteria bacterium]|nr:ComEC/Rec2 family competence protein [Candidatus Yonathbacteria bacterium]
MRSEYFFGFIVSFVLGVALEELLQFGYSFALLCASLSLIIFLLHERDRVRHYSFFVSLVLLGCALGIFHVNVSQTKQQTHAFDSLIGKVARIEGAVSDEPDVREAYTNIILETPSAKILARVPVYPELHYGDKVALVGKITSPKNFAEKDGAKVFDYQSYLAKDDIFYQMYFPSVSLIARDKGNIVYEKLFALKAWLMGNITRTIPEPEASLAGGITLGTKQSLGGDLLQKFRETGVAHIVVLSGYNIAVVAGIISRLVMFMPFTIRLATSALGVILFAMMVGGGATVVRATIMALVVILARALGREGDALRALVLAGGLMVLANPMILLYDVSFQLSFSATLALVTLVPAIEKFFTWVTHRTLREIMVTTFATQIFVLPLILYHMGSVSLIGLVANLFILPVVPLAMFMTALVAVLAVVPLVSRVFAVGAYLIIAYIVLAVEFFSRVPFASFKNISFPLWLLILAYTAIGFFILKNFPRATINKNETYEF